MSNYQRALDFEAALPFDDAAPIVCKSDAPSSPAEAPATLGAWADRQNRAAAKRREVASSRPARVCGLCGASGVVMMAPVFGLPGPVTCMDVAACAERRQ